MEKELRASKKDIANLRKHLVEIKEARDRILDECFPENAEERDEFEEFLDNYLRGVEQAAAKISPGEETGGGFPLVVIGSEVNVEDMTGGEGFKFRIVVPFQGQTGIDDVTCLSPAGKALILKRPGEEVTVRAPAGTFRYRIKDITFRA